MNLCSPREIRILLESRGPCRGLGQNFLADRNILAAILEAAQVTSRDHVLEVGPGLGVLTEGLLQQAGRVTAVEKDVGLHAFLAERWAAEPRLTLLRADVLDLDLAELFRNGVTCLVSNLPYAVGTRVVVDAALLDPPPERMTLLVQLEVAERFAAVPRTPARSALSVWLQQVYDVAVLRRIKPACFWPQPEVVSALVGLRRHARHPLAPLARRRLVAITRLAFQQRRKQMAALFRNAAGDCAADVEALRGALVSCGASPQARAEELGLSQWCALVRNWPGPPLE